MNDINPTKKILLIGIGNAGRGDDALGWKFVDEFSHLTDLFDFEITNSLVNLRKKGYKGKFIIPLPNPRIEN